MVCIFYIKLNKLCLLWNLSFYFHQLHIFSYGIIFVIHKFLKKFYMSILVVSFFIHFPPRLYKTKKENTSVLNISWLNFQLENLGCIWILRIDRKIQLFISKYWATWPSTIYWILLIFFPVSLCFLSLIFLISAGAHRCISRSLQWCHVCKMKVSYKIRLKPRRLANHCYLLGFLSQNLIMRILECLVFRETLWPH